jgi:hypothetical protein
MMLRNCLILDQVETGSTRLASYINYTRMAVFVIVHAMDYSNYASYGMGDIMIIMSILYITFDIHFVNLGFVIFGLTDFRRKLFMQKNIGLLINAERHMNDPAYMKLIPVINFVNPVYLRRWIMLRRTILDLGLKYTLRVFIYMSVFIVVYGLQSIICVLSIFNLINFELPLGGMILVIYDITVIMVFFIRMIKIGAEVNAQFKDHKEILMNIKHNLINIRINYEHLLKIKVYN